VDDEVEAVLRKQLLEIQPARWLGEAHYRPAFNLV